ncbi:MAG: hypothetical protein AB8G96_08155 [Phycisphaerales bacterium]
METDGARSAWLLGSETARRAAPRPATSALRREWKSAAIVAMFGVFLGWVIGWGSVGMFGTIRTRGRLNAEASSDVQFGELFESVVMVWMIGLSVIIPLLLLTLVIPAGLGFVGLLQHLRRSRFRRAHQCERCGHQRLPDQPICPECAASASHWAARPNWCGRMAMTLVVGGVIGTAGVNIGIVFGAAVHARRMLHLDSTDARAFLEEVELAKAAGRSELRRLARHRGEFGGTAWTWDATHGHAGHHDD